MVETLEKVPDSVTSPLSNNTKEEEKKGEVGEDPQI